MRHSLHALFSAIALTALPAWANESPYSLVIDGGMATFNRQSDGVWRQKPFPSTVSTRGGTFSIGIERNRWSLGYTDLGTVRSNALATPTDANYNPVTQLCNGPCEDLTQFIGKGSVRGLYVRKQFSVADIPGLAPAVRAFGHDIAWNLFLEGGTYLFRPTWKIVVHDWHPPGQNFPKSDGALTHNAKLQLGPTIAVGYRVGKFSVVLNNYFFVKATGDGVPSLYNGRATTLTLRYKF